MNWKKQTHLRIMYHVSKSGNETSGGGGGGGKGRLREEERYWM